MKEWQRLAIVEQQCTQVGGEYCEDQYMTGCDGCQFYNWRIVKFIDDED